MTVTSASTKEPRYSASVNAGPGAAEIYDRVTNAYVERVVGVHIEPEAIAAFIAERGVS
jgi:hypothetical protein